MDQKTRLLNALRGRNVDRPPFICPGGMMNMAVTGLMDATGYAWPEAHLDPVKMAGLSLAASNLLGIENVGVPFCMTVEAEGMGARVDIGTRAHEPSIAVYPMDGIGDLDRVSGLDPSAGRARVCADAVRILRKESPGRPVFANLTGPVSLATSLIDPLVFYRTFIKNREGAHGLMRIVCRALKAFGDALVEAGADVVCIADPSASGELLGRRSFREFALPYINELVIYFRERFGIPSIVHICGKVHSLGSALSEIEAESISIDACVRIRKLRQLAPSKVVMGNVNTYLLSDGTPERVRKHGMNCLKAGAGILAPACGISPKTPMVNILSLAEAVDGWMNSGSGGKAFFQNGCRAGHPV